MNILYVHDRPSGGAGESLFQLVSNANSWKSYIVFTQDGFLREKFNTLKPSVSISYEEGYLVSWLHSWRKKGGVFYLMTRLYYLKRSVKFMIKLSKILRKNKIDCLHSNSIFILEAGIVAKLFGIPHLLQVRELLDLNHYSYPLNKILLIKTLKFFSDLLICNSNRTKDGLTSITGESSKLLTIYNMVNLPSTSSDIKHLLNLPAKVKVIAIVGWIRPMKRIEDFISIALLFEHIDNYKFVIIGGWGGDNQYNSEIKKNMDKCKNIIHAGLLPYASTYFESIDILLCPCNTESFGRTVAEALIAGTPAIGIRSCAVSEIIDHEETGYLVEEGDIESFAKYIEILLSDDDLRNSMGAEGKRRMEMRFSSDVILPQYYKLYQRLIFSKS